jgi:hypothetical protein
VTDVVVKGIRQSDGRKVQIATADDPKKSDGSDLLSNDLGGASGIATLNALTEVVQLPGNLAVPRWVKYQVPETAFVGGGTTEDIELFSLLPGGIIHGVKIKNAIAFSGGGATTFTMSVGISGTLAKYASAFDVFQAVSDTTFQLSNSFGSEDHGSITSIRLAATTDATTGGATAGAVVVWVLVSRAV